MHASTDPDTRQAFIASLRQLADYLTKHPDVPVPLYGTPITVFADNADDGGRDQVDSIAALMGTPVTDETAEDGHYAARLAFGDITYSVVAIGTAAHARYQALHSYWGSVTPDEVTSDA